MIVDQIADLVEPHMGGRATAIGLDFHVQLTAAPTPDGRVGLFALFIFCCDSLALGQRLWEVSPPLPADAALDPDVIRQLILDITAHFEKVRAESVKLAAGPAVGLRLA